VIRANLLLVDEEQSSGPLAWAIHSILGSILLLLPFAFGGTQPWSQEIFFALTTALLLFAILPAVKNPSIRLDWNWAYAPILLFLLLAVTQLVSWPAEFISAISPHTSKLRSSLLFDQPNSAALLSHQTFTLYPLATVENLRLLLAVAGIFFAVTQFHRTRRQIEILLSMIAAVGFAVALFAAYQDMTGATTIYGSVPVMHRDSGPFMNHSHFSQFMNLSIGASFGLGLMRWTTALQEIQPRFRSLEDVREFITHPRMQFVILLAVAILVEAIVLLLSMSRMGAISMIAAGAITGVLLSWRTRSRDKGSVMLILGIVLLAVLLCVGFDTIYDRIATVRHIENAEGGRLEMLRDMSAAFKQFPVIGTGLGTHEFVFPMFDHSSIRERATHAENEFAQLLEETGFTGLLLALWFLVAISIRFWVCIRNPRRSVQYAAFGLGFGLVAILIHSFSDFGQHVPANAVLTACSAALLINISHLSIHRIAPEPIAPEPADRAQIPSLLSTDPQARRRRMSRLAFAMVLLGIGAWCIAGSEAQRAASTQWDSALSISAELQKDQWKGTDSDYLALLTPATAAAHLQPQNVKYRYWLNSFRWRSLSRTAGKEVKTFELRRAVLPFVSEIVDDLINAQTLCPTYAPNYNLAGELEHFVLRKPQGMQLVETGFHLNPKDARSAFIAGQFALDQKRWDIALADFKIATEAGADKCEAIELCVDKADQPSLAYQLAESDSSALSYLIDLLGNRPEDKQLVSKCRSDLFSILQAQANDPGASADTIGALAQQYAAQGNISKAISYYRKALAQDYSRVEWHYQLANLLAASGDRTGGMGEARICLRIHPQMKEAETLLGKLSVQSSVPPG